MKGAPVQPAPPSFVRRALCSSGARKRGPFRADPCGRNLARRFGQPPARAAEGGPAERASADSWSVTAAVGDRDGRPGRCGRVREKRRLHCRTARLCRGRSDRYHASTGAATARTRGRAPQASGARPPSPGKFAREADAAGLLRARWAAVSLRGAWRDAEPAHVPRVHATLARLARRGQDTRAGSGRAPIIRAHDRSEAAAFPGGRDRGLPSGGGLRGSRQRRPPSFCSSLSGPSGGRPKKSRRTFWPVCGSCSESVPLSHRVSR